MKQTFFHALFTFLFFLSIATGYAQQPLLQRADPLQREIKQQIFAIKNVNIIPMTQGGAVLQNTTVLKLIKPLLMKRTNKD